MRVCKATNAVIIDRNCQPPKNEPKHKNDPKPHQVDDVGELSFRKLTNSPYIKFSN